MKDDVPVDPARVHRHVDSPRDAGVLSVPVRATVGRWLYQDQWSSWTKRRVQRHMEAFSTREEFVEFAIEAARIRRLPPPNYQRSTPVAEHWAVGRICRAMADLLNGRTLRSNSLHFFNAACDELEGFQWGAQTPVVVASTREGGEDDAVIVEHMAGESTELLGSEELTDLRTRYIIMLIVKAEQHEGIPPDELLDRIERLI